MKPQEDMLKCTFFSRHFQGLLHPMTKKQIKVLIALLKPCRKRLIIYAIAQNKVALEITGHFIRVL